MDKLDIKRAIQQRGWRMKDVAEKLGVTQVAMSQRVSTPNPKVKSLQEVAEIIGCDVRDMFFPTDKDGNIIEETVSPSLTSQSIIEHEQKKLLNGEIKFPDPLEQDDSQKDPMGMYAGMPAPDDIFASPSADDHAVKLPPAQDVMPVTTFCPHCGKKVRVGVVLLPEDTYTD